MNEEEIQALIYYVLHKGECYTKPYICNSCPLRRSSRMRKDDCLLEIAAGRVPDMRWKDMLDYKLEYARNLLVQHGRFEALIEESL